MVKNLTAGLGALTLVLSSTTALAQNGEAVTAPKTVAQKITETAIANRYALAYDGDRFSGPAWTRLLEEAGKAQFF